MKKRLRKKLHLKEFQEFAFSTGFKCIDGIDDDAFDDILDRFIDMIEANHLECGGGGDQNEFIVAVSRDHEKRWEPITDTEFSALEKWYIDDPMVSEYYITGLTDAWYGPFPDESDAEWKAK